MSKKIIAINPGHGGTDRSNKGYSGKYVEADGNLAFCLFLRDELKDHFNVVLTRDKDMALSLTERAMIAVRNKADMFIDVHSDAFDAKASGVTIYDSVDLKNEDIAIKIGKAVASSMGIPFRGHKERESEKCPGEDYYTTIDVAQDGGVPVVLLLERGFHSNSAEEKLLLDAGVVKKSAVAAAEEIKKYYSVQVDPVDAAIDKLAKAGKINSPEYWERHAKKGELAEGESVGWLLRKWAADIKG